MESTIIIIMLALLQYGFFTGRAGFARVKYEVFAPKTVGNESWERLFRIQQNTMEQLIIFVPAILAFSYYVSSMWALIFGIGYLISRQTYSHLYIKNPNSRGIGFAPTYFINIILIVGCLIDLGITVYKTGI